MAFLSSRGAGNIRFLANKITVVVDPIAKEAADIVLITHKKALETAKTVGDAFVISEPGEFEVKGVFVYALPTDENDSLVFLIEGEGVRMLHLGVFAGSVLPERIMNMLERIDVLFVPVGGGAGKDPQTAREIVEEIEPRIVVPLWYDEGKVTKAIVAKEFGAKTTEAVEKLKVEPKNLSEEEFEVVFLY